MGINGTDAGEQATMEEFGWIEREEIPDAQTQREQEAAVEAVLFTMGRSVEIRQLAVALQCGNGEAEAAAERLRKRYEEQRGGMQIVRFEDSYQMCTRADYYTNLIRVATAPRRQALTDVMMETLAIIAYKQPVTKPDIEKIRGVNADHAVNRLVEYGLVCETGRLDAPGRPALFATTEEFLRRFGVGSTEELPEMNPVQREEIRSEVEEELNIRLDADGNPLEEEGGEVGTTPEDAGLDETVKGKIADGTEGEVPDDAKSAAGIQAADKEETGEEGEQA